MSTSRAVTEFANPYLTCDRCRARVSAKFGLNEGFGEARNLPCGHVAGVTSRCPSWSPVDGCGCITHLGMPEPCEVPR